MEQSLETSPANRRPASHIVIGGMSYCGSTLMNFCLGSLPGIKAASETHVTVPEPGNVIAGFDFETREMLERGACVQCGVDCHYFTEEFRRNLQRDPADWAAKFSEILNTETLVTSEKQPKYIESLYPLRDHDMIVLFKHPLEHWTSFERRAWRNITIEEFFRKWTNNYKKLLSYGIHGRKVFANFSEFKRNPAAIMRYLCQSLELEYTEKYWEYWKNEHHYINGNFSIRNRLINNPASLEIVITNDALPTGKRLDGCDLANEALELYDHLVSLSGFQKMRNA